jgi:quinol monooxygenase YgiN
MSGGTLLWLDLATLLAGVESASHRVTRGSLPARVVPLQTELRGGLASIVQVHTHVKPEFIEPFTEATLGNARNSVQEPGIARFDVVQQLDDQSRFVLVEAYRSPDDPREHEKTAHYQARRNTVAEMMAEPRSSVKYDNVFPDDESWG